MKRWLRLAWQLASLALFGLVLYLGGPEAWEQVQRGDTGNLLISLLLLGLASMLSATRLQLVAHAIAGRRLASWPQFYHLNMTTRALGLIVPRSLSTVGGKSVALRATGVSLKRSVWIVLVDNAFDLGLLGLLAIPALLFLRQRSEVWVFVALTLGLILVLAGGLWWTTATGRLHALVQTVARIPRLASILRLEPESTADLLLPASTTLSALALSVLLNSLIAICFYFIAHALRLTYPWFIFAAGFPITQLSLVLAVTPGGLGLFDAGWYGVLRLGGVSHQDALTFVIAQRACIFVFVLVWAGVGIALSMMPGNRKPV
jgi:uncharacterized protein (TIRG00374 family)